MKIKKRTIKIQKKKGWDFGKNNPEYMGNLFEIHNNQNWELGLAWEDGFFKGQQAKSSDANPYK